MIEQEDYIFQDIVYDPHLKYKAIGTLIRRSNPKKSDRKLLIYVMPLAFTISRVKEQYEILLKLIKDNIIAEDYDIFFFNYLYDYMGQKPYRDDSADNAKTNNKKASGYSLQTIYTAATNALSQMMLGKHIFNQAPGEKLVDCRMTWRFVKTIQKMFKRHPNTYRECDLFGVSTGAYVMQELIRFEVFPSLIDIPLRRMVYLMPAWHKQHFSTSALNHLKNVKVTTYFSKFDYPDFTYPFVYGTGSYNESVKICLEHMLNVFKNHCLSYRIIFGSVPHNEFLRFDMFHKIIKLAYRDD